MENLTGFGYQDLESKSRCTGNMRVQCAGISKLFIAYLTMRLLQAEVLDLYGNANELVAIGDFQVEKSKMIHDVRIKDVVLVILFRCSSALLLFCFAVSRYPNLRQRQRLVLRTAKSSQSCEYF